MTESQFTQRLLKALRRRMPQAVILKHMNPLTAGVPDFSVTRDEQNRFAGLQNHTTWCEVKLSSGNLFPTLQFETARRMDAWYIIYAPHLRKAWMFKARESDRWSKTEPLSFDELVERCVRFF
jgi:hypothetical protein